MGKQQKPAKVANAAARADRRPYKLSTRLIQRIVRVIKSAPGISLGAIAGSVGVSRDTLRRWHDQGEKSEAGTLHWKLYWELERALSESHLELHRMATRMKPFEVLVRRYPAEYGPAKLELTGPEGTALIPAINRLRFTSA
jgi:hypothetical protein